MNLAWVFIFAGLVWTMSYPGSQGLGLMFGLFGFLLGLSYVAMAGLGVVRKATIPATQLLVAPVFVALLLVFAATDAPLRTRFALSQGAFEAQVEDPQPAPLEFGRTPLAGAPDRIGSFNISQTSLIGDAVIFSERNGDFAGDARFAYLPSGPSNVSAPWLVSPSFRHIRGDWYSWVFIH